MPICNDGFLVNRSCFDFSNVADDLPEIRKAVTEPDIKIILTCEEDKTYLVNKFGITTENMYMLQDIAEGILQGEIPRDTLQTLADIHLIFYPQEDCSNDTLSQKTENIRKDIKQIIYRILFLFHFYFQLIHKLSYYKYHYVLNFHK